MCLLIHDLELVYGYTVGKDGSERLVGEGEGRNDVYCTD